MMIVKYNNRQQVQTLCDGLKSGNTFQKKKPHPTLP